MNNLLNLFFSSQNNLTVAGNKESDAWKKKLHDRWKKITEERRKMDHTPTSESEGSKPKGKNGTEENTNMEGWMNPEGKVSNESTWVIRFPVKSKKEGQKQMVIEFKVAKIFKKN